LRVKLEKEKRIEKSQRGSNQTEIRWTKMSLSIQRPQNKLCVSTIFLNYLLFLKKLYLYIKTKLKKSIDPSSI
jgi:hypothetical protein